MAFRRTIFTMGNLVFDLPKPIATVCHDACGANQIFTTLQRTSDHSVTSFMEDPAKNIWEPVFRTKD